MDSQAVYVKMKSGFVSRFEQNKRIRKLLSRIDENKATFADLWAFSREVGRMASRSGIAVADDLLQTEDCYNEIMNYLRTCCFEPVADYAEQTQAIQNVKKGISLKALKAEFDAARASGIAHNVAQAVEVQEIQKMLGPSLENFTDKTIADTIHKNGRLQNGAGLKPVVIRVADPRCCEWCQSIAGVYNYEDVKETGNDVWLFHDNCRCSLEFDNGRTIKKIR